MDAVTDLQPLFLLLTLDSAIEFLFGESIYGQLVALPGLKTNTLYSGVDEQAFAECFDEV